MSKRTANRLKLLSWNVRHQGMAKRVDNVVAAIASECPDIINLQEVPRKFYDQIARGLVDAGAGHHWYSHVGTESAHGGHGVLIASRFDGRPTKKWAHGAKYPNLFARVTLQLPGNQAVDVLNVHIPNGASYGWVKVEHFHILGRALLEAPDQPRILTGDFNEPQEFRASGQIVPFCLKPQENGGARTSGGYTKGLPGGVSHKRIDWARAVREVLSPYAHGLQNIYAAKHEMSPTPVTHVVRRTHWRCFDHGFASRHFEILESRYRHDWRVKEYSDHSALVAQLAFRASIPALTTWAT
ncbi:MAG: endonuclease/exonuclease/phosphatase family protein [Myxococcales bacterium]|nr:endonuclease/exonuclease/phosphatase family protein [Myxococcales bacterium]